MPCPCHFTGSPSKRISPCWLSSSRLAQRRSVDLPEPDEPISDTNPAYYDLGAQSPAGVTLAPSDRQTLLESNIEQNETHTVLTFTRLLTDEISIDPNGNNWFLVAFSRSRPSFCFSMIWFFFRVVR